MRKWLSLLLILLPQIAFCYTVIRKDGRSFSGALVRETEDVIVLRDPLGIEVRFRMDQLDRDQTKAANAGAASSEKRVESRHTFPGMPGKWTGEPISVDLKDVDIRDFFRFIAELGGMNLILDPGVRGPLTLKLTDVPWDQVLDLVCRTRGLAYEVDGNVLGIR